jgi:hypothetical protein
MTTIACPKCGEPLTGSALIDRRCRSCGAALDNDEGIPTADWDTSRSAEEIAEYELSSGYQEPELAAEAVMP